MTDNITKSMLKRVMNDIFSFIETYYPQREISGNIKYLGILTGTDALHNGNTGMQPEESFSEIISKTAGIYDYVTDVKTDGKSSMIALSPTEKADNIGDIKSFFKGIILSAGAQLFGICAINDIMDTGSGFLFDVSFEEKSGAEYLTPEKIISDEATLLGSVSGKIKSLQEKIKSLEADSSASENSNSEIFKIAHDLEKANISLKSQNLVLSEKNTELAFQLIDAEDQIATAKKAIDTFEKQAMESLNKATEEEDMTKKRNEELEKELWEKDMYLEISRKELKIRSEELDEARNKAKEYFLQKETSAIEILRLQKQLKKTEDTIKFILSEKEGLIEQIRQLETLNESLQNDFVQKIDNNEIPYLGHEAIKEESIAYKACEILRRHIGESSEIIVRRALKRSNITPNEFDNVPKDAKEKIISEIAKSSALLASSEESSASIKNELYAIIG